MYKHHGNILESTLILSVIQIIVIYEVKAK